MKAILIGRCDPAEILLSQVLVDGLHQRGYSVDHLLVDLAREVRGLLRGVSREIAITSGGDGDELRPSYALVINLNRDPRTAKIAARLAHIKGFGYFFDSASSRVVVKGKAFRYLELQYTSERYPVFHRADLYEGLLTEIDPQDDTTTKPRNSLRSPIQVVGTAVSGHLAQLPSLVRQELKANGCPPLDFIDVASRPLVEVSGLVQGIDLLITDRTELGLLASQFRIPVIDLGSDSGEMNDLGPYSDGSVFLNHRHGVKELSSAIAHEIQCYSYGNRMVSKAPVLKKISDGPRLLWPDMENLTEAQLWDFLLKFSSWVMHFRKPQQSLASLLTRFSAGLMGENIHLHHRFLFHSQLQNIAIIQEKLEDLLHHCGGSVRESTLLKVLKGTPLPRSCAIGWLGLKDDCRSSRPSVGLMYQVRLFVTHLKLQRQLLDHCLGIFEGDSEQVYSD